MQTLAVPDISQQHQNWLSTKGDEGQVSYFKPIPIDADLGYDVYKIFANVTSSNGAKERQGERDR